MHQPHYLPAIYKYFPEDYLQAIYNHFIFYIWFSSSNICVKRIFREEKVDMYRE